MIICVLFFTLYAGNYLQFESFKKFDFADFTIYLQVYLNFVNYFMSYCVISFLVLFWAQSSPIYYSRPREKESEREREW
jgi:hypothetical protein